mgnify:CR=1 FL=1
MKMETIVKIGMIALFCVMMAGSASAWNLNPTVNLGSGTFTLVPINTSNSYTLDWQSDIGALEKASIDCSFSYSVDDTWYPDYDSFYLVDLNGISDDYTNSTAWFLYDDNDNIMPYGLGNNTMEDGDRIKFKYCSYTVDYDTWETTVDDDNATDILNIKCNFQGVL